MAAEVWGGAPRIAVPWHCEICNGPTTLEIIERWWITPDQDEDFDPFERAVAKCTKCAMPYVLGRDADYNGEDSPLEQVFPEAKRPLPNYIPKSIRESHEEAVQCQRARCFTAATLMARRGVEAICAENGYRKGTLAKKLATMQEKGVIDSRLADWSSVVKDLGNSGAHDVDETLTREDAEDAIAFFEALVNYIYTFQRRYQDHLHRRLIGEVESTGAVTVLPD